MRGMVASSSRNVPPSWGQNIRQEPAKRQTGTQRPFLSAAAPSSDSEPIDCPGRHAGPVFARPAAQERPSIKPLARRSGPTILATLAILIALVAEAVAQAGGAWLLVV